MLEVDKTFDNGVVPEAIPWFLACADEVLAALPISLLNWRKIFIKPTFGISGIEDVLLHNHNLVELLLEKVGRPSSQIRFVPLEGQVAGRV